MLYSYAVGSFLHLPLTLSDHRYLLLYPTPLYLLAALPHQKQFHSGENKILDSIFSPISKFASRLEYAVAYKSVWAGILDFRKKEAGGAFKLYWFSIQLSLVRAQLYKVNTQLSRVRSQLYKIDAQLQVILCV